MGVTLIMFSFVLNYFLIGLVLFLGTTLHTAFERVIEWERDLNIHNMFMFSILWLPIMIKYLYRPNLQFKNLFRAGFSSSVYSMYQRPVYHDETNREIKTNKKREQAPRKAVNTITTDINNTYGSTNSRSTAGSIYSMTFRTTRQNVIRTNSIAA